MSNPTKSLSENREHTAKTSRRWHNKILRNRTADSPDFKDEWLQEECLFCQYYVKLSGLLGVDWGVCTNPSSPFDTRLMFEHDGCKFFLEVQD